MSPSAPARLIPARRVVVSRELVVLGAVSALVFAVLAVALARNNVASGAAAVFAAIFGLTAFLTIALPAFAFRNLRRDPGALWVHGGTLLWNEQPLFARGEIEDAIAYTNGRTNGVRVRSTWRTAHFEVDTLDDADQIVLALGKDSGQSAVGFTGRVASAGALSGSAVWLVLPIPVVFRFALALGLLVLPSVAALFARPRWVIGSDGLLVQKGLRPPRFLRYADVTSVEVSRGTLTVRPRFGVPLTFESADDGLASPRPIVGARALARRITQAKERAAERGGEVPVALERAGRDVSSWIEALRGLSEQAASYRVAAVPREALWSALEDVTKPAEVRAAAATALRVRLAEDERPRLRVAAEACASPELRVALEAAEEADDERLAEALEAVAPVARKA